MSNERIFQSFLKHRGFLKKGGVTLTYESNDNSPYLFIDNPIIISSFAGFVKKWYNKKRIYFRGESRNNAHIIPSLFRNGGTIVSDSKEIQNRFRAYAKLKKDIIAHYRKNTRFTTENVDTLFQHYGIKSPVIDLVDNIYLALWFAIDGATTEYGYVRIMNCSHKDISVSELRQEHSSLSLRLHTQHGLVMRKKVKQWNAKNILFDKYEVARIKFPIRNDILGGVLFSKANIYPGAALDNTYKILRNSESGWFNNHVAQTEREFGLAAETLGRVQ